MAVRDSAEVSEGQVLFRLDPEPFQLEVDRLEAEFERPAANVSFQLDEIVLIQRDRLPQYSRSGEGGKV